MSLTNPTDLVNEQRLSEFYQQIYPYLGGGGSGSGGGSKIERLCYGEDRKEADTAEIRLLTLTEDTNFSEYLSYDTTTKLFTVEKAFSARLIVWIYNYAASSKVPQGKLVINGSSVALYSALDNSLGSTGGIDYWTSLSVGDTIGIGPKVSNGYPQVRIKIYKLDGIFEQELFVKSYENSGQGYSV